MPFLSPTRILKAATQTPNAIKWSETLNLPKSTFPARPTSSQLEEYRKRCADDLYTWQRTNRPEKATDKNRKEVNNEFILHDGPPYANGPAHVGHALNKVLKDLITRWHLATGKRVHYRPGWDCHGLPIELKALQAQRSQVEQATALKDAPKQEAAVAAGAGMSASDIRKVARELATQTIDVQRKSFKEWGVMGSWNEPYRSMDPQFEIDQLDVFREMAKKGLISRHHRPVYWSPSSRTALAEGELEYDDNHKCTAAFVKMPFVSLPKVWQDFTGIDIRRLSALIWTTTPWTLPANKAIAVNPGVDYTVMRLSNSQSGNTSTHDEVLVAKDRIEHVLSYLPADTISKPIIDTVKGRQLADGNAACYNVFTTQPSPILEADFVTTASGTGVVHMAPGHGMEDYEVCERNNVLSAFAPVDDTGRYTADAFKLTGHNHLLAGLDVQTEGVKAVLDILGNSSRYRGPASFDGDENLVLASHDFVHKNPIDWRTKQPVIVRATAQWFADVSAIKDRALTSLDDVTFIPEAGNARLRSFVEGRSSWCISRQRAWGVPIPALYHRDTGEACITQDSITHIISIIQERGSDAWFSDPPNDPAWVHSSLDPNEWIRGKDTMDVWFDSGTTWTTLDGRHADVYVEGTDQHRGWFQSSLLTAIATQDANTKPIAPYSTLITHGFTLDAEGRKMSKSLGNVISPDQILDGSLLPPVKAKKQRGKAKSSDAKKETPTHDAMGSDALRLWVASSDYTRDITVSVPVLQSVHQALQKYRVTFKFLLGVLSDYAPERPSYIEAEKLIFADRAVLYQLSKTSEAVYQAYREYKFYKVVSEINNFVNLNLSAFYFEIIKDTMYTGSKEARKRTQAVLVNILQELLKMLGPITPHLVEEVWEHMPTGLKSGEVHPLQQVWDGPYAALEGRGSDDVEGGLEILNTLTAAVKVAQEEARNAGKLGSGLACKVEIRLPEGANPDLKKCLQIWDLKGELADLLVVSEAEIGGWEASGGGNIAWKFEQAFDNGASDEHARGKVIVLPPTRRKCVRCWKYTAPKEDEPCQRCRDVVAGMG